MGNAYSSGGDHASSDSKGRTAAVGQKDSPKCYYELLGVSLDATADELKKAYRQKALQFHPGKSSQR